MAKALPPVPDDIIGRRMLLMRALKHENLGELRSACLLADRLLHNKSGGAWDALFDAEKWCLAALGALERESNE